MGKVAEVQRVILSSTPLKGTLYVLVVAVLLLSTLSVGYIVKLRHDVDFLESELVIANVLAYANAAALITANDYTKILEDKEDAYNDLRLRIAASTGDDLTVIIDTVDSLRNHENEVND